MFETELVQRIAPKSLLALGVFVSLAGSSFAADPLPVSSELEAESTSLSAQAGDLRSELFPEFSLDIEPIDPSGATLLESPLAAPVPLVEEVEALPEPPTLLCLLAVGVLFGVAICLKRKFDAAATAS